MSEKTDEQMEQQQREERYEAGERKSVEKEYDEEVLLDDHMDTEDFDAQEEKRKHTYEARRKEDEDEEGMELIKSTLKEFNCNKEVEKERTTLRQRLLDAQNEIKLGKFKMDMMEKEMDRLKKENELRQTNATANSYSRIDQGKKLHPKDIRTGAEWQLHSEILACRCNVPCTFKLKEMAEAQTTSPTQLLKIHSLLECCPEWKRDKEGLMLASQMQLPIKIKDPDEKFFRAIAHCPTIHLVCQEIPGWKASLNVVVSKLFEQHLGSDILDPCKPLVVLAPGMKLREVPVTWRKHLLLSGNEDSESMLLEALRVKYTMVVFILPFSAADDDKELWEKLIRCVPSSVDVMVLPGPPPSPLNDHLLLEQFKFRYDRLRREEGKLLVISPEDHCQSQKNQKLEYIGVNRTKHEYWQAVLALIKEREFCWPHFAMKNEEEKRDNMPPKRRINRSRERPHGKMKNYSGHP